MQKSLIAEKKTRSPDQLSSLPVVGTISLEERRYYMAEAHRIRSESLRHSIGTMVSWFRRNMNRS